MSSETPDNGLLDLPECVLMSLMRFIKNRAALRATCRTIALLCDRWVTSVQLPLSALLSPGLEAVATRYPRARSVYLLAGEESDSGGSAAALADRVGACVAALEGVKDGCWTSVEALQMPPATCGAAVPLAGHLGRALCRLSTVIVDDGSDGSGGDSDDAGELSNSKWHLTADSIARLFGSAKRARSLTVPGRLFEAAALPRLASLKALKLMGRLPRSGGGPCSGERALNASLLFQSALTSLALPPDLDPPILDLRAVQRLASLEVGIPNARESFGALLDGWDMPLPPLAGLGAPWEGSAPPRQIASLTRLVLRPSDGASSPLPSEYHMPIVDVWQLRDACPGLRALEVHAPVSLPNRGAWPALNGLASLGMGIGHFGAPLSRVAPNLEVLNLVLFEQWATTGSCQPKRSTCLRTALQHHPTLRRLELRGVGGPTYDGGEWTRAEDDDGSSGGAGCGGPGPHFAPVRQMRPVRLEFMRDATALTSLTLASWEAVNARPAAYLRAHAGCFRHVRALALDLPGCSPGALLLSRALALAVGGPESALEALTVAGIQLAPGHVTSRGGGGGDGRDGGGDGEESAPAALCALPALRCIEVRCLRATKSTAGGPDAVDAVDADMAKFLEGIAAHAPRAARLKSVRVALPPGATTMRRLAERLAAAAAARERGRDGGAGGEKAAVVLEVAEA